MAYIKRRITTTLPTTLEPGEEIYYEDANGNLTLYAGNTVGTPEPVGRSGRPLITLIRFESFGAATIGCDEGGIIVSTSKTATGTYEIVVNTIVDLTIFPYVNSYGFSVTASTASSPYRILLETRNSQNQLVDLGVRCVIYKT